MEVDAVIPSKRNRKVFIPYHIGLYKQRDRIERSWTPQAFCHFATRYDRRAIHFVSFINLTAAMLWL